MKIGMKEEMGIANKMRSSNLESRALLRAKRAQQALRAVTLLEATEGDENWHEAGDRHCRQNEILEFGIARAQRDY